MPDRFLLYAPNVHTGGGLVLLEALLKAWPRGLTLRAILDARATDKVELPPQHEVSWVHATLASRLRAERTLAAQARTGDTVLCFHGLPPLLPSRGRVVLFQQNRLLLGLMSLRDFPLRTGLRVAAERLISRAFKGHVNSYVVQTPSMLRALNSWHGGSPTVSVLPFAQAIQVPAKSPPQWDFIYVSDGLPHKNHARLIEAWALLAADGLHPSLALTLGPRDRALAEQLGHAAHADGANVRNLGHLDHASVLALYASSRALIFPSLGESFGLPLIEARQADLPILAPELDYVRDVCEPAQTFDPTSAVSIARAVKRFLLEPDGAAPTQPAHAFLKLLGVPSEENPDPCRPATDA